MPIGLRPDTRWWRCFLPWRGPIDAPRASDMILWVHLQYWAVLTALALWMSLFLALLAEHGFAWWEALLHSLFGTVILLVVLVVALLVLWPLFFLPILIFLSLASFTATLEYGYRLRRARKAAASDRCGQ